MGGRYAFALVVGLVVACARPGVPPGSPERGYVVWGFVGHDSTTPATGQQVTLIAASGEPVQTVTTDGTGKYTFAYHQPGNYVVQVGGLRMPVAIGGADQRLDIDLSASSGEMDYAAGAARDTRPPSCPEAGAANRAGETGERDPSLVGAWSRSDTLSSGDSSMSTKLSLLICADGSYVSTVGDTVGGGAGWSGESRGSDSTRGRWRTEGGVVYVDGGAGWEPYARYYVEGGKLMFTFADGQREIWYR